MDFYGKCLLKYHLSSELMDKYFLNVFFHLNATSECCIFERWKGVPGRFNPICSAGLCSGLMWLLGFLRAGRATAVSSLQEMGRPLMFSCPEPYSITGRGNVHVGGRRR